MHVGIVALLSEKFGHPWWVYKARVFEWGACETSNSAQTGHELLKQLSGAAFKPEVGVAVLRSLSHTMSAMNINGETLAVDGLHNENSEFRSLAQQAQQQFAVLDLLTNPTNPIKFLKPWQQTDEVSCGYHVLHYFHYLLFESNVDTPYQEPSKLHRQDVWDEMAGFLDNICRCRFIMSLGENLEVATRV